MAAFILPALKIGAAVAGAAGSFLKKKDSGDGGGGGAVAQSHSSQVAVPPVPSASLAEDKSQNRERMKKVYGYPGE